MIGDNCDRILSKDVGFVVEQENQIAKNVFFSKLLKYRDIFIKPMIGDNCGRILSKNVEFVVEQENQIAKNMFFFMLLKHRFGYKATSHERATYTRTICKQP